MLESIIAGLNFLAKALPSLLGAKNLRANANTQRVLIEVHLDLLRLHTEGTITLSLANWAIKTRGGQDLDDFCDQFIKYAESFRNVGRSDSDSSVFTTLGIWVPMAVESIFNAVSSSGDYFGQNVEHELYHKLLPSEPAESRAKQFIFLSDDDREAALSNLVILRDSISAAHSILPEGLEQLRMFICAQYDFPAVAEVVQRIIAEDPALSKQLPNKNV